MTIGFDAKRFFNNFTGLGNYSRFVVSALSTYSPENQYTLFSTTIRTHADIDPIIRKDNIDVVTPSQLYRMLGAKSIWRSWGMSREPKAKNLDVFHGLSQELPIGLPTRVKKVVTVHDLIFLRYPKLYKSIDVNIYTAKVKAACRLADKILATSNQTKQDVVDFLKVEPSKIDVIYQGCHPNFKKKISADEVQTVKEKYGIDGEYILNVGTLEERKNMLLVVQAFALLSEQNRIPVVIVGKRTAYKDKILDQAQRLGVDQWFTFLHHVSFLDLPAIYQGAKLFIYPSFFEGFGIPIVEALESSVPVIAATGSCLEEAGGPGSMYVNPNSAEELNTQLTRLLTDRNLRQSMISSGKIYAEQFQPNVIANQLMSVYRRV